jgi:DNA-binding transcriptional LysR family regulator
VNDILNLQCLSQLELRQICYFIAVVEAGNNFSQAADRLQIEQPPLSQRIRALEKALKVELFDRSRRPVQLTAAGQSFLKHAQRALIQLQEGMTEAQRASNGKIGRLAIGISSAISNTLLPDLLREFRQRCPDVELVLRELNTEQQIRDVRDRQLDIGFEQIPFSHHQDDHLVLLPVFQEEFVVVLPDTHPLATQSKISVKTLVQHPVLLPPAEGFPGYRELSDQFTQAGYPLTIIQNVKATWLMTILSLVSAGIGIAILPISNVQNMQRVGSVYRSIEGLSVTRQLSAVWRQDNSSPVLQEFLKVIEKVQGSAIA